MMLCCNAPLQEQISWDSNILVLCVLRFLDCVQKHPSFPWLVHQVILSVPKEELCVFDLRTRCCSSNPMPISPCRLGTTAFFGEQTWGKVCDSTGDKPGSPAWPVVVAAMRKAGRCSRIPSPQPGSSARLSCMAVAAFLAPGMRMESQELVRCLCWQTGQQQSLALQGCALGRLLGLSPSSLPSGPGELSPAGVNGCKCWHRLSLVGGC